MIEHTAPVHVRTLLIPARFVFIALCCFISWGCSGVDFTRENKASIRSAQVAHRSQYPKPDEVIVYTFGQNMAGAFGGVAGALIAHGAAGDDRTRFKAYLEAEKIDPGLIMAEAFAQEFAKSALVPLQKPADATFQFHVIRVGLMIPHGFTAALSPYLAVEGKLIRKDGKILWKQTEWIRDGDVRHSTDDYVSQPGVLRDALRTSANRLARDFVRELQGQSGSEPNDD